MRVELAPQWLSGHIQAAGPWRAHRQISFRTMETMCGQGVD